MPWYVYALLTPVLYSITNYIDKYLLVNKVKEPIAITALSGLVSGVLGLVIGFFTGFHFLGLFQTSLLLLAGILLLFYLLPYFKALSLEDTSYVVPLFQFIPVFTLVLSTVFLKESLSVKQIFGLLIVVLAGVILSAEKLESGIFRPRKALWFMLLSGFMYGCVGILFRFVVRDSSYWVTLSWNYIGTGLGALILLSFSRIRDSIKRQRGAIVASLGLINVNNGLAILAAMSEAYAVTLVAVPLVNIVGGVQPLVILIYGLILWKWFPKIIKEEVSKNILIQKILSIVLIFVGLYLVYF